MSWPTSWPEKSLGVSDTQFEAVVAGYCPILFHYAQLNHFSNACYLSPVSYEVPHSTLQRSYEAAVFGLDETGNLVSSQAMHRQN